MVGFRCSPKLGFKFGFVGFGVYLNLCRQKLAFVRRCFLPAFVVTGSFGLAFWAGLGLCCGWGCVLSSLPLLPASWGGLFRFSVGFFFSVCFVAHVVPRLGFASFMTSVACLFSPAFSSCPVLAPVVKSGHRWVGC